MHSQLIFSVEEWNHLKTLYYAKAAGVPYKPFRADPIEYPCMVVVHLAMGVNGYEFLAQFFYRDSAEKLLAQNPKKK